MTWEMSERIDVSASPRDTGRAGAPKNGEFEGEGLGDWARCLLRRKRGNTRGSGLTDCEAEKVKTVIHAGRHSFQNDSSEFSTNFLTLPSLSILNTPLPLFSLPPLTLSVSVSLSFSPCLSSLPLSDVRAKELSSRSIYLSR